MVYAADALPLFYALSEVDRSAYEWARRADSDGFVAEVNTPLQRRPIIIFYDPTFGESAIVFEAALYLLYLSPLP